MRKIKNNEYVFEDDNDEQTNEVEGTDDNDDNLVSEQRVFQNQKQPSP